MTTTTLDPDAPVTDELDLLASLLPLAGQRIVELGCGAAQLVRALLQRHPGARVTALEVDERQMAANLAAHQAAPQAGLQFVAAGAQAIPAADASFDLALMLKSLHHVPRPLMAQALAEAARVLRPGGHLYVSEPVYGGEFNDIVKLFNEEGAVRAAAQAALDEALRGEHWTPVLDRHFVMPVHFADFDDFAMRLMYPSFADHRIDEAKLAEVGRAFAAHCGADGARFLRPMHLRLLQRRA